MSFGYGHAARVCRLPLYIALIAVVDVDHLMLFDVYEDLEDTEYQSSSVMVQHE